MAKRKLPPNVTPNTLESMIEYMSISSILERICEMTKRPLEYPRDNTRLDPLKHLLKIRKRGIEWKGVINKTLEWLAWQWANVKIDKESLFIMRQNANISKDDMEDYNLAMIRHAMDLFKEHAS
jgi:DNA-binding PucR family transcriptional regulator